MKSVLISIHPQWCEKIVSGKKTIEVRKTAPKEVPFKAYIYCTTSKPYLYREANGNKDLFLDSDLYKGGTYEDRFLSGKVIGHFICDKVDKFNLPYPVYFNEVPQEVKDLIKSACLTMTEAHSYLGRKAGYAWHISDLKIYDKPKELSEFNRPCVSPTRDCEKCVSGGTPYTWDFDEDTGKIYCTRRVKTPPQSWCYVEEL